MILYTVKAMAMALAPLGPKPWCLSITSVFPSLRVFTKLETGMMPNTLQVLK